MHRGYVITSCDMEKVLCFAPDQSALVWSELVSKQTLNKALCLHDLTEGKNILQRLSDSSDYKEIVKDAEVQNIARLYNKFF